MVSMEGMAGSGRRQRNRAEQVYRLLPSGVCTTQGLQGPRGRGIQEVGRGGVSDFRLGRIKSIPDSHPSPHPNPKGNKGSKGWCRFVST